MSNKHTSNQLSNTKEPPDRMEDERRASKAQKNNDGSRSIIPGFLRRAGTPSTPSRRTEDEKMKMDITPTGGSTKRPAASPEVLTNRLNTSSTWDASKSAESLESLTADPFYVNHGKPPSFLSTNINLEDLTEKEKTNNIRESLKEVTGYLHSLVQNGGIMETRNDPDVNKHMKEITEILSGEEYQPATERHNTILATLLKISQQAQDRCEEAQLDTRIICEKLDNVNKTSTDTLQTVRDTSVLTNTAVERRKKTPVQTAEHALVTTYATKAATEATAATVPPPSNPNKAHHPTRLIIQFLPDPVPDGQRAIPQQRMDSLEIVETVNRALAKNTESAHLKIVAASYNHQGNLIVSTRGDQTAAQLTPFIHLFKDEIARGRQIQAREDKRWYKIQADGISTTTTKIDGSWGVHTPESIHIELGACNPAYERAEGKIMLKPRWMRSEDETRRNVRSSVVFAVDCEETAKRILAGRTLAAFGRHCTLRAYQDRPPIAQCKKCWGWDHFAERCKSEKIVCRLCGETHTEKDHQMTDCHICTKLVENGDMAMNEDDEVGGCEHLLKCVNCKTTGVDPGSLNHAADSRRCPVRLGKYGTARNYERLAQRTENPWKVVILKTKTATATKTKPLKSKGKQKETETPGMLDYDAAMNHINALATNSFAPIDPDVQAAYSSSVTGEWAVYTMETSPDDTETPSVQC